MRIIGGKARGTKLYSLEGNNTRPTLDRVKESLFNIIQNDIQDSVFLDLFSGSGAVGLEAISRGAKKTILCDNSKKAIEIIKKNIEKTKFEKQTEVYCTEFNILIKEKLKEILDIVYIDPPYQSDYVYKSIKLLIEQKLINKSTLIIIETDRIEILKDIENLPVTKIDERKYGRAQLVFLKLLESHTL